MSKGELVTEQLAHGFIKIQAASLKQAKPFDIALAEQFVLNLVSDGLQRAKIILCTIR